MMFYLAVIAWLAKGVELKQVDNYSAKNLMCFNIVLIRGLRYPICQK